jgi:hypothetical protein
MTGLAPPTPGWLLPGAQRDPLDRSFVLLAVGTPKVHALRTPQALALPVLARFLADPADRLLVGAVLLHPVTETVYWWIRAGATSSYPPECRLLNRKASIPAPTGNRLSAARCRIARWLHLPEDPRVLTGPSFLASALWDEERAQLADAGERA